MSKAIYGAITISIMLLATVGCSGGGQLTVPQDNEITAAPERSPDSQRMLWGIWGITIDPVDLTTTIQPMRDAQKHYEVLVFLLPPMCFDCLNIKVNSVDPVNAILDADVTIRTPGPAPGGGIYHVRGILYTDNHGHLLLNADDWTGLWDIPGGMHINPFKAFGKEVPFREFKYGYKYTENYLIKIPIPPKLMIISYALDLSFPSNCKEPYSIENFTQTPLYSSVGSTADLQVDVYDWQDDVSEVFISIPEITGEDETHFAQVSGSTWGLEITNNTGATAGDYEALITGKSSNSGELALYDFVTITISS